MSDFVESEMLSSGSLTPLTVASNTAVFNAAGQTADVPVNTVFAVVIFQAHLLGGAAGTATAQLINLTSSEVFATLVLTQAGTFAIDNSGDAFGPFVAPTNGAATLTCRAISATNGDQVAILANLEQVYVDPAA